MRLRTLALALGFALPAFISGPGGPAGEPRSASAAVSVLMSLDDLVAASTYVVVATAGEHHSAWEELGGGRRIVTYTRLAVERPVVGKPGPEIWVRTLGGSVGKLGQYVSGEARIATGSRSLLFLTDFEGALAVTGLAQGHFPIVTAEGGGAAKLAPSPDAGTLLPRRGPTISAREVLVGKAIDEAAEVVRRARQPHERK